MASAKRVARLGIASLVHHSGALSAWRAALSGVDRALKAQRVSRAFQRGGVVLMFHRLEEQADPFRSGTDLKIFTWLCEHLARHYEVLPLGELETRRRRGTLSARSVALTFDDGFACNYHLGLPLLRRHGLPATVFVTTSSMQGGEALWFVRLATLFERAEARGTVEVAGIRLDIETVTARAHSCGLLEERLKRLPAAQREAVLAKLPEQLSVSDPKPSASEMLTWDQLREMHAAGFKAAAHTVTHPILSRVSSEEALHELRASKDELERQLGEEIDLFAYPNGRPEDFNRDTIRALQQTGFRAAWTTTPAAVHQPDDAYCLPRLSFYGERPAELALELERYFYLSVAGR